MGDPLDALPREHWPHCASPDRTKRLCDCGLGWQRAEAAEAVAQEAIQRVEQLEDAVVSARAIVQLAAIAIASSEFQNTAAALRAAGDELGEALDAK